MEVLNLEKVRNLERREKGIKAAAEACLICFFFQHERNIGSIFKILICMITHFRQIIKKKNSLRFMKNF